MPKQKSAYNTLAAAMGVETNNGIENDSKKVASTKKTVLKCDKILEAKIYF